jgi:hypothetical protein
MMNPRAKKNNSPGKASLQLLVPESITETLCGIWVVGGSSLCPLSTLSASNKHRKLTDFLTILLDYPDQEYYNFIEQIVYIVDIISTNRQTPIEVENQRGRG